MRRLILLLLLAGCQTHSGWRYDQVPSKEKKCTRLTYKSDDPIKGIDVEFLYSGDALATYFQVHSHPIVAEEGKKASIRLITDQRVVDFVADIHTGKQRIRLSEPLQGELIKLLKEGKPVTIELKGYRQTLDPKDFEKSFKKLENPPYKVPFHLPI